MSDVALIFDIQTGKALNALSELSNRVSGLVGNLQKVMAGAGGSSMDALAREMRSGGGKIIAEGEKVGGEAGRKFSSSFRVALVDGTSATFKSVGSELTQLVNRVSAAGKQMHEELRASGIQTAAEVKAAARAATADREFTLAASKRIERELAMERSASEKRLAETSRVIRARQKAESDYVSWWQSEMAKVDKAMTFPVQLHGQLATAMTRLSSGAKEAANSKSELASATAKAGKAAKDAATIHGHWTKAAWDAHSAARGLAGSLGMLWVTWGSTIPIVAGAALGASMKSILASGAELQYQATFIKSLSDSAADATVTTHQLAQSIAALSVPLGVAPVEGAKAMRILAQAGYDVSKSLMTLPTVLKLATVGELDMADAAISLVGAQHAFGLTVSDVPMIADQFAKAAAISQTSVQQITESMKQASTVGAKYKVTVAETAVALTVLAERNITGSAAGTAFRNMMRELGAPTRQASELMKQLGFSAYDSSGKIKPLLSIVSELRGKLEKYSQKSQNHILNMLFGERGEKEVSALLAKTDSELSDLHAKIQDSAGFANNVYYELMQTAVGQARILKATLFGMFQDIGEGLSSRTAAFLGTLRRELEQGSSLRTILEGIAGGILNVAEAIVKLAPLLVTITTATFALLGLSSAFAALRTAASTIGTIAASNAIWAAMTTGAGAAAGSLNVLKVAFVALGTVIRAHPLMFLASVIGTVVAGYATWLSLRSKEDIEAEARKGRQADYLKYLDTEIESLKKRNEALERGISLAELEAQNKFASSKADAMGEVRAAKDALEVANKNKGGWFDKSGEAQLAYNKALDKLEALVAKERERKTLVEQISATEKKNAEAKGVAMKHGTQEVVTAKELKSAWSEVHQETKNYISELDRAVKLEEDLIARAQKRGDITSVEAGYLKFEQEQRRYVAAVRRVAEDVAATQKSGDAKAIEAARHTLAEIIQRYEAAGEERKQVTIDAEDEINDALAKAWEGLLKEEKSFTAAFEEEWKQTWQVRLVKASQLGNQKLIEQLTELFEEMKKRAKVKDEVRGITDELSSLEAQVAELQLLGDKSFLDGLLADRQSAALVSAAVDELRTRISKLREEGSQSSISEANKLTKQLVSLEKSTTKHWEKFADQIEQSLTDALMRGFENGNSFGENFVKTLQNTLKTAALKLAVQVIVSPIMGAVRGAMGLDGGGSGGLGGIGNLFSMGNNLLGGGSNLYTNFATSSVGQGLGLSAVVPGIFEEAAALGIAGEVGAGGAALTGLGTALPYVGLALGALALFGGDLFGGKEKPPEINIQNLPKGYKWGMSAGAGPFGELQMAGKHLGETEQEVQKMVDALLKPIIQADTALAALLTGEEVKAISGALSGWTTGEVEFESEAQIQEMVKARFAVISDTIGGWVDDLADTVTGTSEEVYNAFGKILAVRNMEGAQGIAETILGVDGGRFSKESETLADTFNRLMSSLTSVNAAFDLLDTNLLMVSADSAVWADRIVEAFGGLQTMQSSVAAYYDKYYSDAEKVANTVDALSKAFGKLGYELPASKDELRKWIEAVPLLTDEQQKTYAELIKLAPAFSDLSEAMAKTSGVALDAAAAERQAEIEARRAMRKAAQTSMDAARDGLNTLKTGLAAESSRTAGGYAGGSYLDAAELERYSGFVEYLSEAGAELQKLADSNVAGAMDGAISSIKGMMDEAARELASRLSIERLLAGNVGGAIGAATAPGMAGLTWEGNAGAFNAQLAAIQAQAARGLQATANANALTIPDINSVLDHLIQTAGENVGGRGLLGVRAAAEAYSRAITDGVEQEIREGLAANLGRAGLESVAFYFGQIGEQAKKLTAASIEANDALAQTNAAIGRLTSVSSVFGQSAAAAYYGFMDGGAEGRMYLSDPATVGKIRESSLISAASSILASSVTTADAAKVASQLSGQFTDKRGASLLLDGLKQYDSASLETSFTRMNDALIKGKLTEDQYLELLGVAYDTYTGFNLEISRVEDQFRQLREAAKSLADELLVDKTTTPLSEKNRLDEALRQYLEDLAGAGAGSMESMRELAQSSRTYLAADKANASTSVDYQRTAAHVVNSIRAIENKPTATLDDVVAENRQLRAEIAALREEVKAGDVVISRNSRLTQEILEKWDTIGMPAVQP